MRINVVLCPRPEKQTIIPLTAPAELAADAEAVRRWAMAEAMKLSANVDRIELLSEDATAISELWLARDGTWLRERRSVPRFERPATGEPAS